MNERHSNHSQAKQRSMGGARDLPENLLRFAEARILGSSWFSRHVVLDRWFLHLSVPGLTCSTNSRLIT